MTFLPYVIIAVLCIVILVLLAVVDDSKKQNQRWRADCKSIYEQLISKDQQYKALEKAHNELLAKIEERLAKRRKPKTDETTQA